ncbi:GNAT family N-acetyltransferase [Paraburkholderia lycopersici]|uniref:Acetyltransferase (GNAT) domain-containing protein n=1 Tax=Paraburkholderia lycopersici TaxID=416944 RepID=A0A1G6QF68_9BURK|nr:GNAT family N-acetyltransferase [Paraburkholderia lycopersici]SDC90336.1 Acetyltransferase (GNAT) domain-containing protein [Paraburkholderia lycopersici]
MTTINDQTSPVFEPPAAKAAPARAHAAHSIFHERWWLEIATQGNWKLAVVKQNDEIVGEMPYTISRARLWRVSHLPPLTRTLGPVIRPVTGSAGRQMHHRLDVTARLIDQLPECDSFFQVLDPRIDDALAFALHGFTVSARYTFRIDPRSTPDAVWARLGSKTRNVIRSASRELTVVPGLTPNEFLAFYDANLAARSRTNAYGDAVMRQLVNAFVERKAGMLLGAYGPGGTLVAAIGLVWDHQAMYYLLSSRAQDAHCGSISLLLWTAIGRALERRLTFDFDGFSSPSTFSFLSGFGATLTQRLGVERLGTVYLLTRTLKRRFAPARVFAPNL